MKNIILAILAILLVFVSAFAVMKHQDAQKADARAVALTVEAREYAVRAEKLKQNAEKEAAKAVDAQAQTMILKEQLEACMQK